MTTTARHEVSHDSWTKVSDGSANVTVQVLRHQVELVVAQADPDAGRNIGHEITTSREGALAFSLGSLEEADKVWVRSLDETGSVAIVVVTKS